VGMMLIGCETGNLLQDSVIWGASYWIFDNYLLR